MADNALTPSLFGVDPAAYQMAMNARQEDQAMQFAQLTPAQQAGFAAARGGQQFAGITANLFGLQDPMLQQATIARQLASQFDLSKPQGLDEYSAALQQAGLPQLAMQATAASQKMKESQATIYGKTREHLSTMGKLQSERDRLLAINPNDPRIAEYNKAIAAEGSSKTPQLSIDAKMFDFGAGRRDVFLKEVAPIIKQGEAINQSLTLLAAGTPFAQAAFENTVVSALGGDKQKSNAEIKRLINTGSLPTRVENSLRKFLEGKVSEQTADDQKNVLEAVQGNLKRTYDAKRTNILKSSQNVPELRGQDDFIAPTWQETVPGTGAARGQKAFTIGETFNHPKFGVLKVTKVDASGNPIEVLDSKGNVGKPN